MIFSQGRGLSSAGGPGREAIGGMDFDLLRSSLEPWLGEERGGVRYVTSAPASDALAALEAAGFEDEQSVDGLPGSTRFCRLAIRLDPKAKVSGLLIGPERPDSRLHLATIYLPGRLAASHVHSLASNLFDADELPASITRGGSPRVWELFWD